MSLIFWISTWTDENLTPEKGFGLGVPSSIKHLGEFAILGILMANVMLQLSPVMKTIFYSTLFSGSYGVLDEVHQAFVPSRFCTVNDMTVNVLGATVGVAFFLAMLKIIRKINND